VASAWKRAPKADHATGPDCNISDAANQSLPTISNGRGIGGWAVGRLSALCVATHKADYADQDCPRNRRFLGRSRLSKLSSRLDE